MEYPQKYHKTSIADDVLHVVINRPKKLNAYHKAAYLEFGQIFRTAGEDPSVRVIVISGEGRAFCAGLDVGGMANELARDDDADSSRSALRLGKVLRQFQDSISQPHFINKPVIGVAHGPSIGLAIDILSAVDIRIASDDAKFSVREIALGMTADIGTLQRLPKIVGNLGWVKEVSFTGRDFGAAEALAQGFVQQVHKTKDEAVTKALELARDLAAKSPVAMLGTKKSINYALDHTHAESLEQIAEYNSYALGNDFMEGCMAMLETQATKKRVVPVYSNL